MESIDFEKLDNAVVLIQKYNIDGELTGHGSGFFIDEQGTIITNYHVVENAYRMKVSVDINGNKKEYDVDKVLSGNKSKDIAKIIIKNSNNEIFPYLIISKNTPVKGEECFTIGTPASIEYMNSLTEGIISNIYPNGISIWSGKMLQVSAPYTHGSSGGALINKNGQVIGITCGGNEERDGARANINFAIWIGEANDLLTIDKESVFDIAGHYNNIIIERIGSNDLSNFQSVLEYYRRCLEIRIELFGEKDSIVLDIYDNIGSAHFELKNYDTALFNFLQILEIIKKTNSEKSTSEIFLEIGGGIALKIAECYSSLKDKENAFTYYTYCANTRKERIGLHHEKTNDIVFIVKKLASDLKKEKDLPEWIKDYDFNQNSPPF